MSHVSRKITILVLLAISAVLLLVAFPTTGFALPAYATATGQPCSACHVNPAGGGTLTTLGQAFAAIPTHTTNPAAAFAQVSAPAAATATPAAAATPTKPAATAPAATTPAAAATPTKPAATAPAATTPAPTATAATTALPRTGEPTLPVAFIAILSGLALLGGIALRRGVKTHQ